MSLDENFYTAGVVLVIGVAIYFVIPAQVNMEPIPGTMGFSKVGSATLPFLAAWGLILTALTWIGRLFWRYLKEQKRQSMPADETIPPSTQTSDTKSQNIMRPILVWSGMVGYMILIPLLGFIEASALFGLAVGLSMVSGRPTGFNKRLWLEFILGFGVVPVCLYLVFHKFFYVTLPTGLISDWLI